MWHKHKIAGVLINLYANPEQKIKHSPQGLHHTLHLAVLAEPVELEWPPEHFLLEELTGACGACGTVGAGCTCGTCNCCATSETYCAC